MKATWPYSQLVIKLQFVKYLNNTYNLINGLFIQYSSPCCLLDTHKHLAYSHSNPTQLHNKTLLFLPLSLSRSLHQFPGDSTICMSGEDGFRMR